VQLLARRSSAHYAARAPMKTAIRSPLSQFLAVAVNQLRLSAFLALGQGGQLDPEISLEILDSGENKTNHA